MTSLLRRLSLHEEPDRSSASSSKASNLSDAVPLEIIPHLSSTASPNHRLAHRRSRLPPRHPLSRTVAWAMEDNSANHPRRRSSSTASIASVFGLGKSKSSNKRPRRNNSDHISEADEDRFTDDDFSGSTNNSGGSDFDTDNLHSDEGLEDDEETGLTTNERQKRKRRKRRNTRLDERIAGQPSISKEQEKLATQTVIRNVLINTLLIYLWYLFSIAISLYNKWMFKNTSTEENPNVFPYPLFTTCLHQVVQFTLACLVLFFVPSLRPRHDSINPHHGSQPTRQEAIDPKKPLMTKWFYVSRIGPCAIGNALDIGLGNMSLKFISLTFFTMCKSSVLGFVLIFAFLFRLEKPSWKLVGIISTMTVGVIMMVAGETALNVLGFILIMSSACASGFRWSLTQILLLRNPATANPFSTIFFLSPVMFSSLLLLALPVEGVSEIRQGLHTLMEARGNVMGILILLFPGTLAFCMTTSEFALLKRTSVVTLSICGIFKEVTMISAASIVFHDKLTAINITGLLVTIASIATYNYIKIQKMREEARRDARLAADAYQPVLNSEPPEDSRGGEAPAVRQTTRHLIKNSLSIPAGASFLPREPLMAENTARASPVKRPENID